MTDLTSRRILGGGPIEARIRSFTEIVARTMEVARASLWRRDPAAGTLTCVDLFDAPRNRHESGAVLSERECPRYFEALEEERNIAAADVLADPRTNEFGPAYLVPLDIVSMLDVPLRRDGRTIGVLCVEETVRRREWTVEEEMFAVAAANLLNLALESDERRRAEVELAAARDRAESASRAKTRFLRAMSHELRTPLNAILGYADLLAEEVGADARRTEDAGRIRTAGQRLLVLVEEALNLADLDAGRLVVRAERVALAPVVEAAIEAARPLLEGRPVKLEVQVGAEAGADVLGDPGRLRQVLSSLLDNAAKFTREGRIVVATRRAARAKGPTLEVSVSDTGCGLSSELQAELFTPFSPGDDPSARPFTGHGVGLAIARRLCTAMGGEIDVASEPGKGATFTVRLPMLPPENGPAVRVRGDGSGPILGA
jgi:signal transduction histidine kinase